jgi:Pyridoxamine 5'-phosphate oxidase
VRASRPGFGPRYGISESEEGLLSWEWALERLTASRNYWISTTRPDGRPHAMPVWGVVHEGELWFGTGGVKARNLRRTGQLVAHTESGDECVILEGTAEERETTETLLGAYEAKYDFRPDRGRLWVVRPSLAYAWRERDYPQSATRFLPD